MAHIGPLAAQIRLSKTEVDQMALNTFFAGHSPVSVADFESFSPSSALALAQHEEDDAHFSDLLDQISLSHNLDPIINSSFNKMGYAFEDSEHLLNRFFTQASMKDFDLLGASSLPPSSNAAATGGDFGGVHQSTTSIAFPDSTTLTYSSNVAAVAAADVLLSETVSSSLSSLSTPPQATTPITTTTTTTLYAISIKKIRRKKMNKHKWKKHRREVRESTRYNKERRKKSGPMREKQE
ncbi:UNVERIFIED_CONTAM: hypothetical protein HDU68_004606 [Siphonaria sp. JEL0065]|nr:hypothetical protein HDU68_004606 [Siphonaria sp. JEL0065]